MAVFKSYVGKRVFAGGDNTIVFAGETYETTNEKEIEALKGAVDVSEVKAEKPKKAEKPE